MRLSIALLSCLSVVTFVQAAPIAGNGFLGDFTGNFSYNAGSHVVTVTLMNAPTTAAGGRLVGFAFNLPGQPGAVSSVTYNALGPAGTSMTLLGGPTFSNSVSVSPFGDADVGAALGGSWLGGGNPAGGLAVGQSGQWTFQLSGNTAFLNSLTDASFLAVNSTGGGAGMSPFLVRFRGFDTGGSDKVPLSDPNGPPVSVTEIPEPASIAVFTVVGGLGLICSRVRRVRATA